MSETAQSVFSLPLSLRSPPLHCRVSPDKWTPSAVVFNGPGFYLFSWYCTHQDWERICVHVALLCVCVNICVYVCFTCVCVCVCLCLPMQLRSLIKSIPIGSTDLSKCQSFKKITPDHKHQKVISKCHLSEEKGRENQKKERKERLTRTGNRLKREWKR